MKNCTKIQIYNRINFDQLTNYEQKNDGLNLSKISEYDREPFLKARCPSCVYDFIYRKLRKVCNKVPLARKYAAYLRKFCSYMNFPNFPSYS